MVMLSPRNGVQCWPSLFVGTEHQGVAVPAAFTPNNTADTCQIHHLRGQAIAHEAAKRPSTDVTSVLGTVTPLWRPHLTAFVLDSVFWYLRPPIQKKVPTVQQLLRESARLALHKRADNSGGPRNRNRLRRIHVSEIAGQ